jgi:hypothetical protein
MVSSQRQHACEGRGGPSVGSLRPHRYHPLAARAVLQPAAARQAGPACAYRAHSWLAAAHRGSEGATERHDAPADASRRVARARAERALPGSDPDLGLAAASGGGAGGAVARAVRGDGAAARVIVAGVRRAGATRAQLPRQATRPRVRTHPRPVARALRRAVLQHGQSAALVVPQLLYPGLLGLALRGPGCDTH